MSGTSYTRQSTFSDGDTITAALFNIEYNQLVSAFAYAVSGTTGHQHDGTAGEGGNIHTIGDQNFLNKIVVDSSNNRWGVFVEVSGSAVEQIRIQDGAIVPVTDSDIDLGTSSLEFKDGFFDGTIHVDTLDVDANATVAGTLGVAGVATVGGLTIGSAVITEAELETIDTITAGTIAASKAVVVDANKDITGFRNVTLSGELDAATGDFSGAVDIATTLTVGGNVDFNGDLDVDGTIEFDAISGIGSVTVTDILDQDDMSGNSATALATQQSIKAYVDAQQDTVDTLAEILALSNTSSGTNVELTTTDKVQFRDSAIYINSSADGQLDIVADTEIQIAATTIDINGAINASGDIVVSGTVDGRDVATDGTKLDGIEASADVTDTANVTAAGALMDSELTSIASVKALNQGVATGDNPTFVDVTATSLDISGDATVGDDLSLDSDAAVLNFGANSEIKVIHVHDSGLNFKHTATADDKPFTLTLQTGETDIAANDVLGVINFQAPDEATGTDAILVAAGIAAVSEGDFSADSNATKLSFRTGASETATEKMSLSSGGNLNLNGTATMDGLTVDVNSGSAEFIDSGTTSSDAPQILIGNGDTSARSGLIRNYNDASNFEIIASASTTADKNLVFRTVDDAAEARLKIASNGDISFYEDTGSTAKFFWDSSAESLGIGTSSPSGELHVLGSAGGNGDVYVERTSGAQIHTQVQSATGIFGTASNHDLAFKTNDTQRMRIDSSGNVGIGTSSIDNKVNIQESALSGRGASNGNTSLTLEHATDTGIQFFSATQTQLRFGDAASTAAGAIIYEHATDKLRLNTGSLLTVAVASAERMRIDSSGNLLVGTTDTTLWNDNADNYGHNILSHGQYYSSTNGEINAYLNRQNSDGAILAFAKDGTPVGSIGTVSGDLFIDGGSEHTGLRFEGTDITPRHNGALSNGVNDLGTSSARFKDLYLSGGVYLGGTGAANKLDDYEEGTWTPTVNGDATGVIESATVGGYYTKVGNQVTLYFNFRVTTNFSDSFVGGLPFQVDHGSLSSSWVSGGVVLGGASNTVSAGLQNSTSVLRLFNNNNLADRHEPTTTIDYYRLQFSYRTDS